MTDKREAVKKLFTAKSSRVETNKGDVYYQRLYAQCKKRIEALKTLEPFGNKLELQDLLSEEGVDRRDFMKWVSATTAMLMLPSFFEPLVAEAAEVMNRVPVIWIELQDCAGNSEAFIRSDGPKVDEIILEIISLEFQETLMAAAGHQAEAQLHDAVETFKGKYLLFVEGSIPTAMNGFYGTIGPSGETFEEHLTRLSKDAAAIVAVGSCATFGGVPAAAPNPTGAKGVMDIVKGKPIINIPACPANPANMVGVILHYVLTGQIPELDSLLRPKFAFGYRIHDNCERRAHFDAGEFVEEWGDEGAKNNFCLYKMGCKGPMTFNNCSIVRYNEGVNWPIGVGRGCIGCSEPDFWDKYAYERPMADANIKAPTGGVEKTVDEFGLGVLTATAVGIGIHAAASALAGKKSDEGEK
ncbi:hydrogenase small subunit [Hydrogenimonas cancrithermarum]|uniref:Quinone-reactive Ni/Fe-hydrogenase small chain n=1 Tax=Hydrogenimonas cancrithermarum TaxID=2993563 RepID=A0ABN6WU67_9BACT|nr:hydrogenase small subunit [Hydrogenimonas cancrithermarum]BDY12498.1 quinone-reactive Ni/Fe-hydrogenase small chain [Hydrogenimonas cancrithermarum]